MVDSSLSVSVDPVGASLVGLLGIVEVAAAVATDCAVTSPASLPKKNNAPQSSADKAIAARPADNKRFLPAGILVGTGPTIWCSARGKGSAAAPTTGWTGGSSGESESSGSAAASSTFSVWAAIGSSCCSSLFSVSAAGCRSPLTAASTGGLSTVFAASEPSDAGSTFSVWAAIGSSFCSSLFSLSAAESRPQLTAARRGG